MPASTPAGTISQRASHSAPTTVIPQAIRIPYRPDEGGDHAYDREAHRKRPVIDRVSIRSERLAPSDLAMLTITMTLEWV